MTMFKNPTPSVAVDAATESPTSWPKWLPPMADEAISWLWPLIQKQPDFQQRLTGTQLAVVRGFVVGLPTVLPPDVVIDTSSHDAEPSQWPQRKRLIREALPAIFERLPRPHPFDIGQFLRAVLAFCESGNRADEPTAADNLLQLILTIGKGKPFATIRLDSPERKRLDDLDEVLCIHCGKRGIAFPSIDLELGKSLRPYGWSRIPYEPTSGGTFIYASDGWQKAMRILARQLNDLPLLNPELRPRDEYEAVSKKEVRSLAGKRDKIGAWQSLPTTTFADHIKNGTIPVHSDDAKANNTAKTVRVRIYWLTRQRELRDGKGS